MIDALDTVDQGYVPVRVHVTDVARVGTSHRGAPGPFLGRPQ